MSLDEEQDFREAVRGEGKRTVRASQSAAPIGSMGSDEANEGSSADGKLGESTVRDSGPRQPESGGSGASWVPRLRFLSTEIERGEASQEVSEERGRVTRVDSNVTSTSRDGSVCSDGSADSFEDGDEVDRRLSKDGSVASTEEAREKQPAPTPSGSLQPRHSPPNASPRASSPRGPRGGFSGGSISPSEKQKVPLLPTPAAGSASLPPPSPRGAPLASPRQAPGASPRQRTLTQPRDLIEAHKRVESLEEALARWRKENALLSAEIRSLAQPKELDGDMDAKHEGEVDGVAVEEGEGGLVDQLSKVGLVDRGEEEALEAEYSPCAVSTGALDVVGQRAGHCADAPHSVRGGDVQNAPAARPVAFQLDARDITIGRMLGRGAGGVLYEGKWHGALVAVKELAGVSNDAIRKEMEDSFRREVVFLATLKHPNILHFYGAVTEPSRMMMVMELMRYDMRRFIVDEGPTATLAERLRLAVGAATGLLYLHSETPPVVHRDVKPENLLISFSGEVKVCDFGTARLRQSAWVETARMGGTLLYVAPEVHRGENFDQGCDAYALAIVVWELMTLLKPFHDKAEQTLPGMVGWGAERPCLAPLDARLEEKGGTAEGDALRKVHETIVGGWAQDKQARWMLPAIHASLQGALQML